MGLILEYPLTYIQLKKPATAVPHLCVIYIFMQHFTMPPQSCRRHIFHCCSSIAIFKTCYRSHTTLHHHSHTHTLIVILLQIWITVKSHEPCRSKPWVSSKHRICLDVYSSNCYHSKFCDKVTAVISYTCPSMTLFHILKVKFRWTSHNVSMTKLLLPWRQLNSSRKHLIGVHLNIILNTKNAVEGRVLPITVVKLKPLKGKFEGKCPASFVC